jgi:hypothetical protein
MTLSFTRLAVAASAASLVAAGAGAYAAPQAPTTTPTLKATIANGKMTVVGNTSFPAGRLDVSLTAVDKESEVSILTLHQGYTFQDFRSDLKAFFSSYNKQGQPSKAGLQHLRHVIKNVTAYGGLDVLKGKTGNATLLIPKSAGETIIDNDSGNLPTQKTDLTVGAASGPQTLPKTDARIVAKTDKRFGGATTLPAQGTITYKNLSTESPHFLFMQHVKEGTTRKQVIAGLQSNGKPSYVRAGAMGTDVLTTTQAQTLQTNLPAGEYALICFFPDPQTGQPHAFMGMVRIVHLK